MLRTGCTLPMSNLQLSCHGNPNARLIRIKGILRLACRRTVTTKQGPIVLAGNLSYVAEPLKLGALKANRFGIVLRNLTLPGLASEIRGKSTSPSTTSAGNGGKQANTGVKEKDTEAENGSGDGPDNHSASLADGKCVGAPEAAAEIVQAGDRLRETVELRCACVRERGFINYFGLQRFGTGGAPTSEVGLAMLKEDWEGAVKLIMTPRLGENEATHDSKVHMNAHFPLESWIRLRIMSGNSRSACGVEGFKVVAGEQPEVRDAECVC